jgi:hypothetical protein
MAGFSGIMYILFGEMTLIMYLRSASQDILKYPVILSIAKEVASSNNFSYVIKAFSMIMPRTTQF